MYSFYKSKLSLLILGLMGYITGHLLFHGVKAISKITFTRKELNLNDNSNNTGWNNGVEVNTVHPLDISVIKMDLQGTRRKSVWLNPNIDDRFCGSKNKTNKVWVVTPTFRRMHQVALLTRVAQALYPVRHFVNWIVIDEYEKGSDLNTKHIEKYLRQFSIPLIVKRSTPRTGEETVFYRPKGVDARNDALKFFRENSSVQDEDVVYFADDDNGYDSEIFYQMRYTEEISMWPTGGLTHKTGLSSPVVRNGKLVGYFDGWVANRRFPVDFAMFAISVRVIRLNEYVNFAYIAGYIETLFLQNIHFLIDNSLRPLQDCYSIVQPMANNCTEILTWHTKFHYTGDKYKDTYTIKRALKRYNNSANNLNILYSTYALPLLKDSVN